MKKISFALLLLCSFYSSAQVHFEEGYIIDNNGNRIETLIWNKDWLDNPTRFTYQSSLNSSPITATVDEVKEFGIGENVKYVKFTGEVDVSPQNLRDLHDYAEPKYVIETVFLKVLLEGEVNLYKLKIGAKESYYFKEEGGKIKLLEFKKYLRSGKLALNHKYRNQLYSNINCQDFSPGELLKIEYKEKDLLEYFKDYHICRNSDYKVYKKKRKAADLNLSIKGGVDFSSLEINSGYLASGTEHQYPPNIRAGAEAELIMPFLRNKWGIFLESTYRSNTFEGSFRNHPRGYEVADLSMELNYITMAGGIRHYMFLNDTSKIFINFAGNVDVPLHSHILFDRDRSYILDPELEKVKTTLYFSGGLGYNYKKLSAEVRYELPKKVSGRRTVLRHYDLDWRSTTSTVSVILGYRIF